MSPARIEPGPSGLLSCVLDLRVFSFRFSLHTLGSLHLLPLAWGAGWQGAAGDGRWARPGWLRNCFGTVFCYRLFSTQGRFLTPHVLAFRRFYSACAALWPSDVLFLGVLHTSYLCLFVAFFDPHHFSSSLLSSLRRAAFCVFSEPFATSTCGFLSGGSPFSIWTALWCSELLLGHFYGYWLDASGRPALLWLGGELVRARPFCVLFQALRL